MAIRHAVAAGNWSNTATWNGGTLPGAGDYVYCNGFIVNIDQDITVAALRNDTRDGHVSNSSTYFSILPSGATLRTVNASVEGHNLATGTQNAVVRFQIATSSYNLIWNGDWVPNVQGTVAPNGILYGFTAIYGTVTFNGNVYTNTATSAMSYPVLSIMGQSTAPLLNFTLNGNVVVAPATTTVVGKTVSITTANNTWNGYIVPLAGGGTATSSGVLYEVNNSSSPTATTTINTGGQNLVRPVGTAASAVIVVTGGTSATLTAPVFDGSTGATVSFTAAPASQPLAAVINGNITMGTAAPSSARNVIMSASSLVASTLTINGSITRSSNTGATAAAAVLVSGDVVATTLNGNITAGGHGNGISVSISNALSTVTVNGNVAYGDSANSSAINQTSTTYATPVVVNGTVDCTATGNHGIGGNVVNTATGVASLSTTPALLRCTNIKFGPYSVVPCNRGFYVAPTGNITVQTTPSGVDAVFSGNATGAYPAVSDVKLGVSYGSGLTGTMAIPIPANVSLGVPVGNATGTHQCPVNMGGLTG